MKINPLEWIKLYKPLPVSLGQIKATMTEVSGKGMLLTGVQESAVKSVLSQPVPLIVQRVNESFPFEVTHSQVFSDENKGVFV